MYCFPENLHKTKSCSFEATTTTTASSSNNLSLLQFPPLPPPPPPATQLTITPPLPSCCVPTPSRPTPSEHPSDKASKGAKGKGAARGPASAEKDNVYNI
ncbi:hypothetical protein E2C01_027653 [Portunus trituberculatus]|uniref:Uncharacterized protein n=1 Tax=Portunus trituberculatus TaxID=210409 RepID=A0A5B7ELR1_PORTR|nr:hypothetical protein [Portunus trituberculatus]